MVYEVYIYYMEKDNADSTHLIRVEHNHLLIYKRRFFFEEKYISVSYTYMSKEVYRLIGESRFSKFTSSNI